MKHHYGCSNGVTKEQMGKYSVVSVYGFACLVCTRHQYHGTALKVADIRFCIENQLWKNQIDSGRTCRYKGSLAEFLSHGRVIFGFGMLL